MKTAAFQGELISGNRFQGSGVAGGKQGRDCEEDRALEEEGRLFLIQQVRIASIVVAPKRLINIFTGISFLSFKGTQRLVGGPRHSHAWLDS